jgi:hypothetical protein
MPKILIIIIPSIWRDLKAFGSLGYMIWICGTAPKGASFDLFLSLNYLNGVLFILPSFLLHSILYTLITEN